MTGVSGGSTAARLQGHTPSPRFGPHLRDVLGSELHDRSLPVRHLDLLQRRLQRELLLGRSFAPFSWETEPVRVVGERESIVVGLLVGSARETLPPMAFRGRRPDRRRLGFTCSRSDGPGPFAPPFGSESPRRCWWRHTIPCCSRPSRSCQHGRDGSTSQASIASER